MPDVNGGRRISLQCLDQVAGLADDSFVAQDVPRFVAARIRVQPPGRAWGIAGYSEGGYCAANLALRHPMRFGFAAVMSGYFRPMANRIVGRHAIKSIDPFRHNGALRMQNSPLDILRQLPAGSQIPQFWVAAARAVRGDVMSAVTFVTLLRARDPATPLTITPDGAHNAVAWRSMIPPMLEWMTPRLAQAAAAQACQACVPPTTAPSPPAPSPPAPFTAAPASAGSSSLPKLNRPSSRLNQDQVRGNGPRPADARRSAAFGAGRLPDLGLRAIG